MKPYLPFLENLYKQLGPCVGAEIGVWRGSLTKHLLANCPNIKKLHSVDPYKQWAPDEYVDHRNRSQRYLSRLHRNTKEMLAEFGRRSHLMRMTSKDAAKVVKKLDFVFIDANHAYEWVKEDIKLWYPRVKPGGIFSGHDYDPGHPEVMRAVDEFAKDTGSVIEYGDGGVWYHWKVAGKVSNRV